MVYHSCHVVFKSLASSAVANSLAYCSGRYTATAIGMREELNSLLMEVHPLPDNFVDQYYSSIECPVPRRSRGIVSIISDRLDALIHCQVGINLYPLAGIAHIREMKPPG